MRAKTIAAAAAAAAVAAIVWMRARKNRFASVYAELTNATAIPLPAWLDLSLDDAGIVKACAAHPECVAVEIVTPAQQHARNGGTAGSARGIYVYKAGPGNTSKSRLFAKRRPALTGPTLYYRAANGLTLIDNPN